MIFFLNIRSESRLSLSQCHCVLYLNVFPRVHRKGLELLLVCGLHTFHSPSLCDLLLLVVMAASYCSAASETVSCTIVLGIAAERRLRTSVQMCFYISVFRILCSHVSCLKPRAPLPARSLRTGRHALRGVVPVLGRSGGAKAAEKRGGLCGGIRNGFEAPCEEHLAGQHHSSNPGHEEARTHQAAVNS